jgi:CRP-like cAMP-binding protein
MRHKTGDEKDAALALLPGGVRELARVAVMRRNELLFRRGDPARAVFCVLTGEVRLARCSASGVETVVHRARPGEFFGEASLAGGGYHCDAVCSVAGRVASLPVEELRACMLGDASVATAWIQLLSRHLRAARTNLERLRLKGARQRILHYLAVEPGGRGAVKPSPSLRAWASELGLAEETLYRALADLEREGVIRRRGRSVALLDATS